MRSLPSRRQPRRQAAAAVEFALVLPFLVTLLLGMFEISRVLLVKETLSNAAQQACRTGARPGKASSDVTAEVDTVMSNASLSQYSVTILVNDVSADVSTASRGDKVSVKVGVPVSQVFWVSTLFISGSTVESETVVMMRQG
jgi:Flp pilus assembly protein TadG